MRRERLPLWKRISRSLDSSVDICGRSLRDLCNLFSRSRIGGIEECALDWLPPFAIDEVTEASLMPVEPQQRILRVLGSRAIFHGEELLSYAHLNGYAPSLAHYAIGWR